MSVKTRYELERIAQRFDLLQNQPDQRSLTIADHYCRYATAALLLRQLVDFKRTGEEWPGIDEMIGKITKQIQDAHAADFGILLEWEQPLIL